MLKDIKMSEILKQLKKGSMEAGEILRELKRNKESKIDEFGEDEHGFYLWEDARVAVSKKDGKVFFNDAVIDPRPTVIFALKGDCMFLYYGSGSCFCGFIEVRSQHRTENQTGKASRWIKSVNSLIKENWIKKGEK